MKKQLLLFVFLTVLFPVIPVSSQSQQSPTSATSAQLGRPTIDDMFLAQNLTATLLSPDGKSTLFMIKSDSGVNLWIADGSGGTRQLTSGNQIDENPRWSPDSQWLAFQSDRPRKPETAGAHQIWIVPAGGGEASQLTHGTFDVRTLAWMPDGKSLAILAGQKSDHTDEGQFAQNNEPELVGAGHEDYCIFVVSVANGKANLLYESTRPITSIAVSPKGDEIAFVDQPNWREPEGRFHSVLKAISVSNKTVRTLSGGELSSSGPTYSPDANWIVFRGGPQKNWTANRSLYVIPSSGGAVRPITSEFDEDVREYMWASDSKSVYFTGADGMNINLFRGALGGEVTPVYTAQGITRSFSVGGNEISFVHESPSELPNVFLAPTPRPAGTRLSAKQITDLDYGRLGKLALGKVVTIHWKNKNDGLKLEGQLLTPPDYQPGHNYPLLVVLHGGPNGQYSNDFVLRTEVYPLQVFAAEGYVVFMPNPRGSNGYGQKFREMVRRDWGGADFQDIESGVDDLIAQGIADKNRMGIMGWSYGGYLAAWAITHTDRFRAASVGAGPVNLFTMYGGTDIPEFMDSYFGGTPWTVTELYRTHSPIAYIDRVKVPTLIQHGAGDGRVPTAISHELYRAIKANGVDCELILYPDTWHSVYSPKLVRDGMRRNLDWFDRYIRNAPAGKLHAHRSDGFSRSSAGPQMEKRERGGENGLRDSEERAMATFRLIEYKDASAEVRAIYDDIMATRKTDWINNFWKAIAHDPATLKRTWESIKQIMAPGALDPLTKEMIYVAVSVTNNCNYCIASHTASAFKKGMTPEMFKELQAVIGMANETNKMVTGYQVEIDEQFKAPLGR